MDGRRRTTTDVLEVVLRITVWTLPGLVAFSILTGRYLPPDRAAWPSTLPLLLYTVVALTGVLVYWGAAVFVLSAVLHAALQRRSSRWRQVGVAALVLCTLPFGPAVYHLLVISRWARRRATRILVEPQGA